MEITTEGDLMEKIVTLCKRRGFVFQSSEIYGGFNGFWDYGPYGVAMKKAIEQLWWSEMVEKRDNVVGLDSTIICHPKVWKASGHIDRFGDIMCDCRDCKARHRVDQMPDPKVCPVCGSTNLTPPREFNLMMKTYVGPVFDDEHVAYLRAETCQPIFVDFHLIRIATRMQLPFGIAQIGKSFRNEITPRMFTFRSREFSQMEMEFFCSEEQSMEWYRFWKEARYNYYRNLLEFREDEIQFHDHDKLAHYAKAAVDIEFKFPFCWGELEGIHHRGTWDMSRHQEFSCQNLEYFDPATGKKYLPTVVETSVGLDRTFLAVLSHAYDEQKAPTKKEGIDEDLRIVLHIPPRIAPVQVAVLPLSKKLNDKAAALQKDLWNFYRTELDLTGNIGKRYRRQDEIGTPYCVTYDFESDNDNAVTVRDRDSMEQERVSLSNLRAYLDKKVFGY